MLIYKIFISVLLLSVSVFASNKMTFYGCPEECDKQEDPSCGGEIDTDYFCALVNIHFFFLKKNILYQSND